MKRFLSGAVCLMLVFTIMLSMVPPAAAVDYPEHYLINAADEIPHFAGDYIEIEFAYFPVYDEELVHTEFYAPDGTLMYENDSNYADDADPDLGFAAWHLIWTSSAYSTAGVYTCKISVQYKSNGTWYTAPNVNTYKITLMSSSDRPDTGWYFYDGDWMYYKSTDEFARNEVVTNNGKKYYFESNGDMATGWVYSDDGWYYFGNEMKTGWQCIDGSWYYFNTSGIMQTGWVSVSGKWYYLSSSGVMQTGWQKIDGKWYYLNTYMRTGWQKISGSWYYLNTDMKTGWQKIGGSWYYLGSNGAMRTGWQKISNKWYYLNSSGVMQTGWLKLSGTWYYLNSSGVMVTGTQVIDGVTYRFSSSGALIS